MTPIAASNASVVASSCTLLKSLLSTSNRPLGLTELPKRSRPYANTWLVDSRMVGVDAIPRTPATRTLCVMTHFGSIVISGSYGMSISSISAFVGFCVGRRGSRKRRGMAMIWSCEVLTASIVRDKHINTQQDLGPAYPEVFLWRYRVQSAMY